MNFITFNYNIFEDSVNMDTQFDENISVNLQFAKQNLEEILKQNLEEILRYNNGKINITKEKIKSLT